MADVLVLVVTIGFFALCIAYVRWCDAIIGDDPAGTVSDEVAPAAAGAATLREVAA